MCGRYHFVLSLNNKGQQIKQRAQKLKLTYKQGEIFPSDEVLCIIPHDTKIDLTTKKWGIKAKKLLINARVETIKERYTCDLLPPLN